MKHGIFSISLDFELHWGVSETKTIQSYKTNLDNTRLVIDHLLHQFAINEIHVTWATVGMLFCKNKEELLSICQKIKHSPSYKNPNLSNYRLLTEIGNDAMADPYHFGADILQKIESVKFQEIATHTFSHFYCMEEGSSLESFDEDIQVALNLADLHQHKIKSIVFPRNQYTDSHIEICASKGIQSYRGTESHWIYRTRNQKDETKLRRLLRLIDTYLPLTGPNAVSLPNIQKGTILNIPSSRFLRPYHKKLAILDGLKLRRIKNDMTIAAKEKQLYHLWWHPHNFGNNPIKNFQLLDAILHHFKMLQNKYGMESRNMDEIYSAIVKESLT